MHKPINHPSVSVSASYSAAVEVAAPTRWLFISGQVGRDADRNIPDGIEAQAEIAWRNLVAILTAGGMTVDDIADTTLYLVRREDNAGYDHVRAKWMGDRRPASTKIYVSGLSDSRMLCEIQAVAVK
jgi:enamine deaminase RidA (YjgF/YER057c/UK114 family)